MPNYNRETRSSKVRAKSNRTAAKGAKASQELYCAHKERWALPEVLVRNSLGLWLSRNVKPVHILAYPTQATGMRLATKTQKKARVIYHSLMSKT